MPNMMSENVSRRMNCRWGVYCSASMPVLLYIDPHKSGAKMKRKKGYSIFG